jgi:Dolichyl-phosphate-mannose-protein mannosyltransferase
MKELRAEATEGSTGRRLALVIVFFFVLTIFFSWPAVRQLSTHVIGYQGDSWQYPWNIFIFREAVLKGENPYYTDYIYYPVGTSLLLHNYTEFNDVIGLILSPFFNDIACSNLGILLATFLTGLGTYLLTKHITGSTSGALFAGIAFAFCPNRMFRSLGQVHMALTEWIPFTLWAFLKLAETQKWKYAVLTALFYSLACYCNYYFGVYLILALLLILLFGIIRFPAWRSPSFFGKLAVSGILVFFFLSPIMYRIYLDHQQGAQVSYSPDVDFAVEKSASISDYIKVGPMNRYLTGMLGQNPIWWPKSINTSGWMVLGLAFGGLLVGIRKEQRVLLQLLFMSFCFFLLSLGPYWKLPKLEYWIVLPYSLLMKIPVVNHVRFPARFSIMVTLVIAIFAGYMISSISARFQGLRLQLILLALFLLTLWELSPVPIPMRVYDPPAIFASIAGKGSDSMLTVPFIPGLGRGAEYLRFQLTHRQKLLAGKISRTPEAPSGYFSNIPITESLYALSEGMGISEQGLQRDRSVASQFSSFFHVRYLTIYPPFGEQKNLLSYASSVFPEARPLVFEKGTRIYEIHLEENPSYDFDASEDGILFFLYKNWILEGNLVKRTVVCSKKEAQLLLPHIKPDQDLELALKVRSRSSNQEIVLRLGNEVVARSHLTSSDSVISFRMAGSSILVVKNLLTIQTMGDLELISLKAKYL